MLAALPLWGWWITGLFDLDEGFYGAVVREMLERGDWIIPYYNGVPWFEKPILFYWLAAPCVWVFGEDVGPRLPSVIAAMGLYGLVGRSVARQIGPAAARWTVLVLATSPVMAAVGRLMLVDSVFVFVLSAAFLAFHRSIEAPRWRLGGGALLGLAVLAKGPVALILMAGVLSAYAVFFRESRSALMAWKPNLGALCACLAVVAVWYVPAALQGGEAFVQDFLIKQNLGRFTGGDAAHRVPWYLHLPYYFLIVGFGMLPWAWRICIGWPRRGDSHDASYGFVRFCAVWAAVIIVFFTASGSKLPHYVVPAFVPLAIIIGRTFETAFFGWLPMLWGIVLSVALNVGLVVFYSRSGQQEAHNLIRWLRSQKEPIGTYQLSRRQTDRGTGKADIQETSLPSLRFYLGRELTHAETFEELAKLPTPSWVFTRKDRIVAGDLARLSSRGLFLRSGLVPVGMQHYVAYRLEKSSLRTQP